MAESTIDGGIGLDAAAKNKGYAGTNPSVYIGNVSDLTTTELTLDNDGYATGIPFAYQKGLYKFTSVIDRVTPNDDIERIESQIPIFNQSILMALVIDTPLKMTALRKLAQADRLFAVIDRLGGKFHEIYGLPEGLKLTAAPRAGGPTVSADATSQVTLSGVVSQPAQFLKIGENYSSTITGLEALLAA